jgi:hypothetical protein
MSGQYGPFDPNPYDERRAEYLGLHQDGTPWSEEERAQYMENTNQKYNPYLHGTPVYGFGTKHMPREMMDGKMMMSAKQNGNLSREMCYNQQMAPGQIQRTCVLQYADVNGNEPGGKYEQELSPGALVEYRQQHGNPPEAYQQKPTTKELEIIERSQQPIRLIEPFLKRINEKKDIHQTLLTVRFDFTLDELETKGTKKNLYLDVPSSISATIEPLNLDIAFKPKIKDITGWYRKSKKKDPTKDSTKVLIIGVELIEKDSFLPFPVCIQTNTEGTENWNTQYISSNLEIGSKGPGVLCHLNPYKGNTEHLKLFDHSHLIKGKAYSMLGCLSDAEILRMFDLDKKNKNLIWVDKKQLLYAHLQSRSADLKKKYEWYEPEVKRDDPNDVGWASFPAEFVMEHVAHLKSMIPDIKIIDLKNGLKFNLYPTNGPVSSRENFYGADNWENLKKTRGYAEITIRVDYAFVHTETEEKKEEEK